MQVLQQPIRLQRPIRLPQLTLLHLPVTLLLASLQETPLQCGSQHATLVQ